MKSAFHLNSNILEIESAYSERKGEEMSGDSSTDSDSEVESDGQVFILSTLNIIICIMVFDIDVS